MRTLLLGTLLGAGLTGLATPALAAPGLPGKPSVPKVPDLPEMGVAEMLNAIADASRKLDVSTATLFSAEMNMLEALGRAEMATEYREKRQKLEAQPASEERDAEMLALTTDEALIDAMVEALSDKENKMDDERKKKAREANIQIIVSRLMAAATAEDVATVGASTVSLSKKIADGDKGVLEDIANEGANPKTFVAGINASTSNIKKSASAQVSQSKEISKVVDKYRKKKGLGDKISMDEATRVFEQSDF